ncbi:MAG TPA: LPS assembly lipoprotein LptE [Rhizomicrobium sp.]
MTQQPFRFACGLALALATGACGFHPLYGEIGNKPGGQSVFHSIYVDPILGERIGYELRNNLIQSLQGSASPDGAVYRLRVTTTQGTEGIAVEPDASITRYNFNMIAHYELADIHTGRVMTSGTETTLSEYDVVSSPYSTLIAQQAAQERATQDVANRIRVELAVFFHNAAK